MTRHKTPEEAIDAAKKSAEEQGFIDFDGQNCNDWKEDDEPECSGWDGSDNRCDCGNRRVNWETYGDDNEGYVAFACAN